MRQVSRFRRSVSRLTEEVNEKIPATWEREARGCVHGCDTAVALPLSSRHTISPVTQPEQPAMRDGSNNPRRRVEDSPDPARHARMRKPQSWALM